MRKEWRKFVPPDRYMGVLFLRATRHPHLNVLSLDVRRRRLRCTTGGRFLEDLAHYR